jgi:KDO2-lipid IV(A) lauroyltransferase
MKKREGPRLFQFWQPRYWPVWLGIGCLRLCCLLPYRRQIAFGKAIGRLAHRIAGERRAIARRNIELCLPELTAAERDRLALEHFEAMGASLMEVGLARWASDDKIAQLTTLVGLEHIEATLADGYGVILLSAHFTALEVCGRHFKHYCPPYDVVYRRFRNELTTEFIRTTRERSARRAIEKNDIKSMIRSLRDGAPVWYAADQAYDRKQAELLHFFGVPAMTNVATSTLARLGKAKALPFIPRRRPEGGYEVTILPPIEGLPSDDPAADTQKYLDMLETEIRKSPEQYYWLHRRFKRRPAPLPDVYADLDALK